MIVNKYNTGGGGSYSGGSVDSGAVQTQIDNSLNAFSEELQEGTPIVGMSKQLYSPDGVTSEGLMDYRTTAGDADVNSGVAELRKIGGNSIYPELQYNDSAALSRGGEEVTGFTYDIEWGDFSEWITVENGASISGYSSTKVSINRSGVGTGVRCYWHFITRDGVDTSLYEYYSENISIERNATAITSTSWAIPNGTIVLENGDFIATLTGGTDVWALVRTDFYTIPQYGVFLENVIPNDIPNGESTYTYSSSDSAWTPSLPQALQDMEVDGNTYVPEDGDVITINRVLEKEGRAQFSTPRSFVALGLNSFNKGGDTVISQFTEDNGVYSVVINAVAGLEDGYVIYDSNSGITAVGISESATGTTDTEGAVLDSVKSIVYPTTAKPYIHITTTDIDTLCVHPRWSGYRDEDYEEYSESKIDGLLSYISVCPMHSVGDVRNIIDLENGQLILNIETENYYAERVNDLLESGYTLGVDFDFDDTLIYKVRSEPVVTSISVANYQYKANDFSVEYFVDSSGIIPVKVYAETYYMNNLVDKLRRLESDFIHLDNPNTTGETGKTYEYQGRLMKWVEGSGYTAEWLRIINSTESDEGTGLIYATIPDGTTLFEFKYLNTGTLRKVVYSGETLYLTETGGSVVCAVTVGNYYKFESYNSQYAYIEGVFESGYIGFKQHGGLQWQSVLSGKAEGGHYELIDKYNRPYIGKSSDVGSGIVKFNGNGQVVGKKYDANTKTIYFNTTDNSNSISLLCQYSYFNGDRMFVPTTSGTQGQILQSNGNAEPTWSNWIKVVKITSDDYEALVTKDPNTLYVIDDE